MFDAKTYNDVRKTIGAANCLFAGLLLLACYTLVLTPAHAARITSALSTLKLDPVWSGLISIALLSATWAYIATSLLRLHDRVYEPTLVKWRASYDSDFILRCLCFGYSNIVSPRLFEEAYDDSKKRNSFMYRLFYDLMGDETKEHQAILSLFYTEIRNYWLIVLAELYCLGFLIIFTVYWSIVQSPQRGVYRFLFFILLAAIGLRILANFYLDKPRRITRDQIRTVLREHKEDFEKRLREVAQDYDLRAVDK